MILHDAKAHRARLAEYQPAQHLPLISPAIRRQGVANTVSEGVIIGHVQLLFQAIQIGRIRA